MAAVIMWTKKAAKQLMSIDMRYRKAIQKKVNALSTFPDVTLDIKKLQYTDDQYRIRVGDYRVIFRVDDDDPVVCSIEIVKRRTSKTYYMEEPASCIYTPDPIPVSVTARDWTMSEKIQYITDVHGKPQFVVLPVEDYHTLLEGDHDESWEDVPYTASDDDQETIPSDVINIMIDEDVSLLAAWRIYSGMSQYDVAEQLGTTQSAVSQWEAVDSRPQKKTREKLAALYGCRPSQMLL
ncbi:mRNA-degrading endonuclease RelE of RelBE toxin-antitoxin system [Enterobacillus tribolii]|uniref:mRNA-degrading endonuclease RelE of RelBE toxin-antitoxin system n=2 Tax=Enterobacillus tribolii TaxID=1487935 RepID=A0A370R4N9_9GAMM|nr:mRNA-degrading endonuclease RelE of RelBE toxin-antitoxin system [Enterobacillus tribolii]